jgi:anti-sigma regulatory factor (Ser/Thr protein kinase)
MTLNKNELRMEFPATLEAVEGFCAEFQLWRAEACPHLDAFSTELLLREALTNSVVHGAAEDHSKKISCVLRAKLGRLLIVIQDEGEGFDWRAAWDRHADNEDTHGRGMEILRHYANAVRFNLKGNSVTLVKRFAKDKNK